MGEERGRLSRYGVVSGDLRYAWDDRFPGGIWADFSATIECEGSNGERVTRSSDAVPMREVRWFGHYVFTCTFWDASACRSIAPREARVRLVVVVDADTARGEWVTSR